MKRSSLTTIIFLMVNTVLTSSCTECAMLSSGATIAVSHNAYAKAYSGLDFLTIIGTEKDIKTHIYHTIKKEEDATK